MENVCVILFKNSYFRI